MNRIKGLVYGVISSSTFGLIPFFALPVLRSGVGVNSLVFYRFALSAILMGIILMLKHIDFRVNMKELGVLSALGLFYALTGILLTSSYLYLPSGIATTIHFLYPVVVTLIMIFFFKDKVSFLLITAIVMAITGVYLMSSSGEGGMVSVKGLAIVLITVLTYALYIVGVNKSNVSKMDGLKLTFYVLLVGAVVFGINLLLHGESLDEIPDFNSGFHLVMLALLPTLVSDFTLVLAVQNVGSTTTAVLGCMEPLTAIVMGILFFGEHINMLQGIGMIVILVAVCVVILANSKERMPVMKDE